MYTEYFGLTETPFTITPDPRYLYMSKRHQEALAHLLYGLKEGGGFVQLTGEVGTGKTTLTRALLEQLPEDVDVALILNPKLTALEFVASICDDLKVSYQNDTRSVKVLIDALNAYLLEAHSAGRRVVLIVDEAQNFQSDVLEQIRLLTNLETTKHKLLQIILVGQPELRELLLRTELRQLAQRITARYHLLPMTKDEAKAYIQHRLNVAGASKSLFSEQAIRQVQKFSGGVPRLINIICDRALLGAYSLDQSRVSVGTVKKASVELQGNSALSIGRSYNNWLLASVIVLLLAGISIWQFQPAWFIRNVTKMPHNNGDVVSSAESVRNTPSSMPAPSITTPPVASVSLTNPIMTTTRSPGNDRAVAPTKATDTDTEVQQITTKEQLYTLLNDDLNSSNLDLAFSSLFEHWGVNYDELVGVTGCERAISALLHCFWSSGSWQGLLSLNRPAIIWLVNRNSAMKHYLVITDINDGQVMFSTAGRQYSISTDILKNEWMRKYLILWRPPALDIHLISKGDRGEIVVWLRRNLDKIQGEKALDGQAEVFDQGLKERVIDFQRSRALTADGLVGEKTLIHITTASNDGNVPLITAEN